MKLGGLFSGVGGFELAWTQLGHEVAWMCEWDAKARKVLEARFPGVPIYPDVRDLDPAEVEAVDVMTGGSPCQGFSVAGSRSGLEHSESQLFADYVRIMNGLADRGLRYAVWENVPGVLSITNDDGERTFEHVVAALAGGTEPVRLPADKRWNAGLASGRGRAVAWRVLDSRYFGVAQRRRRVFACVAFGDSCEDRAGRSLLAVAEGVRGDSPSGVKAGEGVAGGVEGRFGVPSVTGPLTATGMNRARGTETVESSHAIVDVAHTLTGNGFDASEDGTGRGTPIVPQWWSGADVADSLTGTSDDQRMPDKQRFQAVIDAPTTIRKVRSSEWVEDETGSTLAARDYKDSGDLVVETQAFRKSRRAQSNTDDETWIDDGGANTLNVFDVGDTRTTHAIVEPKEEMVDFGRTSDRIRINAETAATLQSGGGGGGAKSGLYMIQGSVEGRADTAGPGGKGWKEDESFTLNTADRHSIAGAQYGVRRLTPVECERLQSFPDGWTEPSGSDSARYKAMGNAVTVNVVRWILGRLP